MNVVNPPSIYIYSKGNNNKKYHFKKISSHLSNNEHKKKSIHVIHLKLQHGYEKKTAKQETNKETQITKNIKILKAKSIHKIKLVQKNLKKTIPAIILRA